MASAALTNGNFEELMERDLEDLLREQNQDRGAFDLEREELNIFRSGSAPPTVEGSRTAIGSLFGHTGRGGNHLIDGRDTGDVLSEEEMRSHPAYLSFYYSNDHLNPRLPPPMVSKEDWRAAQRFRAGASPFGGIGDSRRRNSEYGNLNGSGSSLFSSQPGLLVEGDEKIMPGEGGAQKSFSRQQSVEWSRKSDDALIGLPDSGLGSRRKSFADALQVNRSGPTSMSGSHSRPLSHNAFLDANSAEASDLSTAQFVSGLDLVNDLQSGSNSSSLVRVQSLGSSISRSFASAVGSSLSRSTTPDPQVIRRSPSPCLPPVGVKMCNDEGIDGRSNAFRVSSHIANGSDVTAAVSAMSCLSLSMNKMAETGKEILNHLHNRPDVHFSSTTDNRQYLHKEVVGNGYEESLRTLGYSDISNNNGRFTDLRAPNYEGNAKLPMQPLYNNAYKKASSMSSPNMNGSSPYQNGDTSNDDLSGRDSNAYIGDFAPPLLNNRLDTGGLEEAYLNFTGNQMGSGFQVPIMDPVYGQYLRAMPNSVVNASPSMNSFLGRNYLGSAHLDMPDYQNAYIEALLAQQKFQTGMPFPSKSGDLNNDFYGSDHAFGIGMPYLGSPMVGSFVSSLSTQSRARPSERLSRLTTVAGSTPGGSMGSWNLENGHMEENYLSSLLEEFKNNKTRSFELSDIIGHVVEFSSDQYGSRFIQQKLENASVEEKNKIFPEILPQARALMTDVFGNYVIQKFFEHGSETQRRQLASQLKGHILQLSLQMYGCRVIQKALEVVDLEQQTQMALELDGSIMRCVRDQNGNHVIQKCIECVPQERIQFIMSAFYGHVVALSTHPYGCRVIQRVLEHCDDPKTQNILMDEIMQSVCSLAQDQYGNYVIQHLLQNGKQDERSAIISKLAGQIVKMSQQKFASNVVEKCLTYGTPDERQLLINEMLGTTDENEPLQVMMKDQFANYVVQKVLETCDDRNRELILSRIKVHLTVLKRYTYGKHIVTRVEKLITAGERRIGISSSS